MSGDCPSRTLSWNGARLNLDTDTIQQCGARVNEFCFAPPVRSLAEYDDPKYADPRDQIDTSAAIEPGPDPYCDDGF